MSQEPHTQQGLFPESSPDLSDRTSTKPPDHKHVKSPLQRQFSVVKRNAITLRALPQALGQGIANAAKGQKHSHSSRSPEMSQTHKSEGEKKRRFSGSGRAKSKSGGKGKNVNSGELGEQEKTSWSPVNKRRAPDTRLDGESDDVEDNKQDDVINVTFSMDGPRKMSMTSSPTFDLVSHQEHDKMEKMKEKPFALKKNNDERTTNEEDELESSPANLFFSFKEELLKRATESKTNNFSEGDKVTNDSKLLNGCEHDDVSPEDNGRENGDSPENDLDSHDSDLKEENLAKDNKRKCSEAGSVNSNSTRSVGSRNTSVSDEIEPPIAPKSVQKLRQKFLNINDMIDVKHKNNLAKKSVEIQRELRSISAWKQQSIPSTRKASVNSTGKTTELKKPRKSVKELRKMYSEGKAVKEKSDLVRSKSLSSATMERKSSEPETTDISPQEAVEKCDSTKLETEDSSTSCTDADNSSHSKDVDNSSQSKDGDNSSQSKDVDNSSQSKDVNSATGNEEDNDENGSCAKTGNIVVINIDYVQGKIGDIVVNDNQISGMSHETRTCTVIKSDDDSSKVPSLQIEPASPDSSNGERCSPGLKRHAASHDSGIDMPSYMQSNLPGSVPDDKIPAGNLKVAAEFSFPGNGPSVLSPDKLLSNETVSDLQASADNPLSPATDYSPEVLWSLPLSVDNRASLTDTSSSCSSPRISVIIAQEASTTKINSRFFTVETMEPWDFEEYRIAEEHQCVMEVEGEFCFGREKSKTSRAEREAIFSLHRDAKSRSCNSNDLIKEEEITLSPSEIDLELQTLEALHRNLERRGVEIEHSLRESMDCKYGTVLVGSFLLYFYLVKFAFRPTPLELIPVSIAMKPLGELPCLNEMLVHCRLSPSILSGCPNSCWHLFYTFILLGRATILYHIYCSVPGHLGVPVNW